MAMSFRTQKCGATAGICGELGTGSLQSPDVARQIFSQPVAIICLDIIEDLGCLRIDNYDVQLAPPRGVGFR
jgi:hypothetical protein